MRKLWSFLRRAALGAALLVSGGAGVEAQTYPGTQEPWFLTADIILFVDGSAGNDSNSGMAAGSGNAWATFAPLYKFLCNRSNGNGHVATIQVANAASIAGAGGIGGQFALTCTPPGYAYVILNLGGGTLSGASGFDTILVANSMMGAGFLQPALHLTNGTLTCSGGGNALHVATGVAVIWSGGYGQRQRRQPSSTIRRWSRRFCCNRNDHLFRQSGIYPICRLYDGTGIGLCRFDQGNVLKLRHSNRRALCGHQQRGDHHQRRRPHLFARQHAGSGYDRRPI